jgi:DNA-binding LytR/AlgR family response regulator
MAALALTQFAFRSLFKIELTTRIGFLGWLLVEFFIISVVMHMVNTYFLSLPIINLPEYLVTLKYTLMVLVLPYFLAILLLFVEQQLKVVQELTLKVNRSTTTDLVTIHDENGKVALTLPLRNILYFKSEDNYIFLYHKHEAGVRKELIRTTLKKLEQELDLACLMRIHRSYMINCQNLISAIKTSRGYQVKMDGTNEQLPVSATYQLSFEEKVIQ